MKKSLSPEDRIDLTSASRVPFSQMLRISKEQSISLHEGLKNNSLRASECAMLYEHLSQLSVEESSDYPFSVPEALQVLDTKLRQLFPEYPGTVS